MDFESVTIGYVFKAEYFLPENASNILDILSDPFNPTTRPISDAIRKRRRRSDLESPRQSPLKMTAGYDADAQLKFEKYDVEAVEIESGANKIMKDDVDDDEYQGYDDGLEGDLHDDHVEEDEENVMDDILTDDDNQYTLNDIRKKQPGNLATARFTLYRGIEKMAEKYVTNFNCSAEFVL